MDQEEADNIMNALYPEGEARWYKLKILDKKKCMKTLCWHASESHPNPTLDRGYSVEAIGVRPEYIPQLHFLMELRDTVMGQVVNTRDDYLIERVQDTFKTKLAELKELVIKETAEENGQ